MNTKPYVVRGTLGFVLRCCRVFGTAPLLFEKFQNGYKITVSYKYALYSYILITFLNANFIIGFVIDLVKGAVKAKPLSNLAFVIPDAFTAMCSSAFGSYYGVYRMKKIIMNLSRLHEAKMNLNAKTSHETTKENIKLALFLCYIVPIIIFYSFEVRNYYLHYGSEILICTNYTIFTLSYLAVNLFEIQTIMLLLEVQSALRSINNELKDLLITNVLESMREKIEKIDLLSHAYITVCDVLYQMNESDGGFILIIFTNFIITLVTSLYYGIQLLSTIPLISVFLQNMWCIMYIKLVLVFIESCHYIHSEVKYINVNLGKLINNMTPVGRRLPVQMDIMYKQLILNKPTYSPMRMFTMRRSLIITFSGAIITYVLFMVQMKFSFFLQT